jgi:hypothetical protein
MQRGKIQAALDKQEGIVARSKGRSVGAAEWTPYMQIESSSFGVG